MLPPTGLDRGSVVIGAFQKLLFFIIIISKKVASGCPSSTKCEFTKLSPKKKPFVRDRSLVFIVLSQIGLCGLTIWSQISL